MKINQTQHKHLNLVKPDSVLDEHWALFTAYVIDEIPQRTIGRMYGFKTHDVVTIIRGIQDILILNQRKQNEQKKAIRPEVYYSSRTARERFEAAPIIKGCKIVQSDPDYWNEVEQNY